LAPASTLFLIIVSRVRFLVLGTTRQIKLPPLSIIPKTGILSFQLRPWVLGAFLSQRLFGLEPPKKASSISTSFLSMVLKIGFLKVSLKRCKTNHADF
jgi:hypothetical protein